MTKKRHGVEPSDRGATFVRMTRHCFSETSRCTPDPEVARMVGEGLSGAAAVALVRAWRDWRRMEVDGAPEGWPEGSRHYLTIPATEDDCRLAQMFWGAAEHAALHPRAEQLDALWVRRFRKARGLDWRAPAGPPLMSPRGRPKERPPVLVAY